MDESELLSTQLDLIDLSKQEQDMEQESLLLADTINKDQASMITTLSSQRGGFCVKEFEEQLSNLQKENFNLKLRIYYLEKNNPNVPEDANLLIKENVELKIRNETLSKDVDEKQELLIQASKALGLLEEAKLDEEAHSDKIIEDLRQQIESLTSENQNLQHALTEANNKTHLGNDTGYAEFLGAVDAKDAEIQRRYVEMAQCCEDLGRKLKDKGVELEKMKTENENLAEKIKQLQYEKSELKDQVGISQSSSNELQRKYDLQKELFQEKINELKFCEALNAHLRQSNESLYGRCDELQFQNFDLALRVQEIQEMSSSAQNLEKELQEFKEKWAASQCDLLDAQTAIRDTDEELKQTYLALDGSFKKIEDLKEQIRAYEQMLNGQGAMNKSDTKKDPEIERHSIASEPPRFSFDYLYETFNDLKFQQAMDIKKQSQNKINELMTELGRMATTKIQSQQLDELKAQMKIVVEKQEIADSALNRCSELCAYTLDHLHELTQFLATLLQNKEIRKSLSEASIANIKNVLEKSLEFSNRQSIGANASISNMSAIDFLVNAARQSISNIRDAQHNFTKANKSIQMLNVTSDNKYESIAAECEELKRVNENFECEISELQSKIKCYEEKMIAYKTELAQRSSMEKYLTEDLLALQKRMIELNEVNEKTQEIIEAQKIELTETQESLKSCREELANKSKIFKEQIETKSQTVENLIEMEAINRKLIADLEKSQEIVTSLQVDKIKFEKMYEKSDKIAKKLETRLKEIDNDLHTNWITKSFHETSVKHLKDEIVNAEAHVAAIRMELHTMRDDFAKMKEKHKRSDTEEDDYKENQYSRRTIEISDDRKMLLMTNEGCSAQTDSSKCTECEKNKAKIITLKKYLNESVDQLKKQQAQKARYDRSIKDQINKTENVMHQVRVNMETILKTKNDNEK